MSTIIKLHNFEYVQYAYILIISLYNTVGLCVFYMHLQSVTRTFNIIILRKYVTILHYCSLHRAASLFISILRASATRNRRKLRCYLTKKHDAWLCAM